MAALTSASAFVGTKVVSKTTVVAKRSAVVTRAGKYDDELLQTAVREKNPFSYLAHAHITAIFTSASRAIVATTRESYRIENKKHA